MIYLVEFSRATGIPVTGMTGRGMMRSQTDARHLYWKLLHEYGYSYSRIAAMFNRPNHSTAVHGIRSVEQLLEIGDKKVMKLYGQTKQFFEMSRKHNTVEIIPPPHAPFNMSEEFEAGGFRCPSCNGRGGFEYETGRDKYKRITCSYCSGSGKIKANVTVKWEPDWESDGTNPGRPV